MATVTVLMDPRADVNSAFNARAINRTIRSLTGTSDRARRSRISTADATVSKVQVRSVNPIEQRNSAGELISSERAVFEFPYAPNDISIEGLTDGYSELERPGLKPLLRRDAKSVRKVSFTAKIVNREGVGYLSCEPLIALLSSIASLNVDLYLIGLGVLSSSIKFRITDMSVEAVRMNPDQQITIADVSLTFTEVIEVGQVVPGMTLLKDLPRTATSSSKPNSPKPKHKSGSRGEGPSGEEIDNWTRAKRNNE